MRRNREPGDLVADPIDPETRFETRDVHVKAVMLTGAGVLAGVWIIVLLTYPVFSYFAHVRAKTSPPPIQAAVHGTPQPPEPRLQDNPQRDLKELRAYEDAQLSGYHWLDRVHGTASIPIERAMRILAARGIPPQPSSDQYFDPQSGARETGFQGKVEPR